MILLGLAWAGREAQGDQLAGQVEGRRVVDAHVALNPGVAVDLDPPGGDVDDPQLGDAGAGIAWEHLAEALGNRANVRADKGDPDCALADLDRAITLNPRQAAFYINRGRVWLIKGGLARALSDLSYAIELDPRSADALATRGHFWGAKGDFARAIADYDQVLGLKPRWADVYGYRGLARLMQGKLAEAEADFARCRALGGSLTPEAERLMRELKRR